MGMTEQIILNVVEDKFGKKFFVEMIQGLFAGLSCCADKTLYCAFFSLLLNTHYSHELKNDIVKILQIMKKIFIENNVCSLVTKHGLASVLTDDSMSKASFIFEKLKDDDLIDCTGTYLPNVTINQLESFHEKHNFDDVVIHYINMTFNLQSFQQNLSSNSSLTLWLHELYNFYFCLILQTCTTGCTSDTEFNDIMTDMNQLRKRYDNKYFLKFMNHLYSITESSSSSEPVKRTVPFSHLKNLLKKCITDQWFFPGFLKHFVLISPFEGLNPINLTKLESQIKTEEHEVNEIIDEFVKPQFEDYGPHFRLSVLEDIKDIMAKIKKAEVKPAVHCPQLLHEKKICKYTKDDISDWVKRFKKALHNSELKVNDDTLVTETFAVIRRGVTLYYEMYVKNCDDHILPRDTQMIASLLFCKNLSDQRGADQGTKLLQQISTGEGKTLIICMVAIYKALLGKKVDIVTSSSVLATRDAKHQKPLYDLFEVSVLHCCHEDIEKRRKVYREADVIYGDIGSFQRDILETEFYDRQIRVGRKYDTVFVDEVDSMLVDKGENMLYLPHPIPDMSSLDQVYLEIWLKVNSKDFLGLEDEQEQLYDDLQQKIFGSISKNLFCAIPSVNEDLSEQIFQRLVEKELIDEDDNCINWPSVEENFTSIHLINQDRVTASIDKKMLEIISSIQFFNDHNIHVGEIIMILQQHREKNKPLFTKSSSLYKYVKFKLPKWIQSAIHAKYFQEDKEYIVDIDKRESAINRYPKIIIMDNETGVEQESAEWADGLHQFLQLKHNLRLTTESLKAVYMSNITFFSKYINLCGVTGTLGSSEERCLFNKLYENTRVIVMPTYKPSRLKVESPICCSSSKDWEAEIERDLKEKLVEDERVVLLICDDKKTAVNLHGIILSKQWYIEQQKEIDIELYVSCHQEKLEQKGKFCSKRLIIATNIAGRGTDIKLSDEVIKKGGLHVLLSFLPANVRVELQAYGRAARGGEPGSCKMIFFMVSSGSVQNNNPSSVLSDYILKRDLQEASRVADIEKDYFHNIKFQEELFQKFQIWYGKLKLVSRSRRETKLKPRKKLDRTYLDQALDNWAFFLDHHAKMIESIPTLVDFEIEKKIILQTLEKDVMPSFNEDDSLNEIIKLSISRLLQLAHTTMKKEEVEIGFAASAKANCKTFAGIGIKNSSSMDLYLQVLQQDPCNLFARYYFASAEFNKAFNKGRLHLTGKEELLPMQIYIDQPRRKLKQHFYMITPLFKNKIRKCQDQVKMLQIANMHQDPSITAGTPYFQEQKEHEIEVYEHFISTMEDVTGRNITEESIAALNLGEDATLILWNWVAKELAEKKMIKKPRIAKNYQDRLKLMLSTESLYYTYGSRITSKIESLSAAMRCDDKGKVSNWQVEQDDFKGALPADQTEFWDTLVLNRLITSVEKDERSNHDHIKWGYWNPSITDLDAIDFRGWYITEESFDWIDDLSEKDRKDIVLFLKHTKVINVKGRLIDFDLAKPFNFPKHFDPLHYKAIKDTLWHHSVNWFALDHLRESCSIIILDQKVRHSSFHHDQNTSSKSVLEVLFSMNPQANGTFHPAVDMNHIKMPSLSQIEHDSFYECLTEHIPNKKMNHQFLKQLKQHDLQIAKVSGDGMNCMINALFQHSKKDYLTSSFTDEASSIRSGLHEAFPDASIDEMLHCDDQIAEYILRKINDTSISKIGKVSVVIASSDGPIIYGGTSDFRYANSEPIGRHVVLWQQGFHYVPIIHSKDYYDSMLLKVASHQIDEDCQTSNEQLTSLQLRQLSEKNILKEDIKNGCYKICKSEEQIVAICNQSELQERLKEKLKVDFVTLNNFPLIKYFVRNETLFVDLQKYHIIKGYKLKLSFSKLQNMLKEKLCHTNFLKKKLLRKENPMFVDWSSINNYLEAKDISPVEQYETMERIWPQATLKDLLTHILIEHESMFKDEQKEAINKYDKAYKQLQDQIQSIVTTLHGYAVSCLLELETPEITLRKLEHVYEESIQERKDIIEQFINNQCNFTITLAEKKWSTRMLIRSGIIIALGVAQIAAGVAFMFLPGIGAYIGEGLIGEGVGDIVFAGMGLMRGHVTWRQYFISKAISLVITLALGALGKLAQFVHASRGTVLSKYDVYKIFGSESIAKLPANLFVKKATSLVSKKALLKVSFVVGKTIASVAVNAILRAQILLEDAFNRLKNGIHRFIDRTLEHFDSVSKKASEKILKLIEEKLLLRGIKVTYGAVKNCFHAIFNKIMVQFLPLVEKTWDYVKKASKKSLNNWSESTKLVEAYIEHCEEAVKEGILMFENEVLSMLSSNYDNAFNHEFEAESMLEYSRDRDHQPLNETEITRIMNCEHEEVRNTLKLQVSHQGELLKSKCKFLVKVQLEDLREQEKESQAEKDGILLNEFEKALDADTDHNREKKKTHASQIVVQYEFLMKRLILFTCDPLMFAKVIEHHDVLLAPQFAISIMADKFKQPIKLVNEKNAQLLNDGRKRKGEPLIVMLTTKNDQYETFVVNGQVFSVKKYGNNCILFAIGAPNQMNYLPHELRKEIADKCLPNNDHATSLSKCIKNGSTNCIEFRLVGAGKLIFTQDIYEFVISYGKEVQQLQCLNCDKKGFMSEEKLTELGLQIVHIIPIHKIKEILLQALNEKNKKLVKSLLTLIPASKKVKSGNSVLGNLEETGEGREVFQMVYRSSHHLRAYETRVKKAKGIIKKWSNAGKNKMANSDFETLISILNCAPANLYLDKIHHNENGTFPTNGIIERRKLKIHTCLKYHARSYTWSLMTSVVNSTKMIGHYTSIMKSLWSEKSPHEDLHLRSLSSSGDDTSSLDQQTHVAVEHYSSVHHSDHQNVSRLLGRTVADHPYECIFIFTVIFVFMYMTYM